MTTETSEDASTVDYTTVDQGVWDSLIWDDGYHTGYEKGEAAGTKWMMIGYPVVAFLAYIIGFWAGSWLR